MNFNASIDRNAPIGVFDSGVGGLTVMREIMRQLPDEKAIYFGDTARVPYGSKSKNTIIKYSRQIANFLLSQNVKAIVVACNTASAFALEEIKHEIPVPVIGVVKPGAKVAVEATKNKRIGIIGTKGTVSSKIYTEFINNISSDMTVIGQACPLFVPLVEEGFLDDPVTDEVARRYLQGLQKENIDTLILGCTHYPLIRKTVGRIMGSGVTLVNPAYETARELKELLIEQNLHRIQEVCEEQQYFFYVSDSVEQFEQFADSILPINMLNVAWTSVEQY